MKTKLSYLLVALALLAGLNLPLATLHAQVGYAFTPELKLRLDVFNLFNRQTDDITYHYTSRLQAEPPQGVDDIHLHPGEPRSFRVSLAYRF